MTADRLVALLIDADNVPADLAEVALADLGRRGLRPSVVRAYGSVETLLGMKDLLRAQAGRAIVNQGRGTTDAALVVDVMDLLHGAGLPPVVAIVSSDADFAPLVIRLRESGRDVLGYAQPDKADMDTLRRVYLELVPLQAGRRATAPSPARRAAAPAPAKAAAASRVAAKTAPAKAPAPADRGEQVWAMLARMPGFREGDTLELNAVVKALKDAKLMAKSASAPSFFKKLALPVELSPVRQPHKLRRSG